MSRETAACFTSHVVACSAERGLFAGYGTSQVLRGVAFAALPRQTISLMGRNGMGKTTLLRTLLRLLPARASSRLMQRHLGVYGPAADA